MLLVIVASVVVLAASSVFLLAYFSAERAARPEEPRWRAFRNGLRRRQRRAGPVEVSLTEMLQRAELDTPVAAFDQVRQRAVEQVARAAGLAAALVTGEPSVSEPDQVPEQDQASEGPFADLSFSELEVARAELTLAELTLARLALAEPDLPVPPTDQDVTHDAELDAEPDRQHGNRPSKRQRARTA